MTVATYQQAKAQFIRTHNSFGLDAAIYQLEEQGIKFSALIIKEWESCVD